MANAFDLGFGSGGLCPNCEYREECRGSVYDKKYQMVGSRQDCDGVTEIYPIQGGKPTIIKHQKFKLKG